MNQRLVLFAKRPRPGKVKTRLGAALGARTAAGLYRAFLADQLRLLEGFRTVCQVELTLDGPWEAVDGPLRRFDGLRLSLQGPGDLGARMLLAFTTAFDAGCRAVVIGADTPTLPFDRVRRALVALRDGARGVIAPARDGGYVLLGLQRPEPALFERIGWGGPRVFAETCRRAASACLDLVRLDGWYDVDDAAALELLRDDLTRPALRRRAPDTARFLDALDSRADCVV